MTTNWTQGAFASAVDLESTDTIMGVRAGVNARFKADVLLFAANNLDNLADAAAARTNLGLGLASNVAFANVFAGSPGTAGVLRSYPAAFDTGYLGLSAVANAGNYAGIIKNASLAQATTWTLSDPGNAAANIVQTPGLLVSGNFVQAVGVNGIVVDSGFGINNVVRYASVAVSSANFLGMYAAPVLLVAAPGANQLIVVDQLEVVMTYNSAAYAAGGLVFAQYDSTANGAGVKATNTEAAADFFAAASNSFVFSGANGALPFTTTVNKGLYLSNATGAFISGNSTFVVKVHYRIIATA